MVSVLDQRYRRNPSLRTQEIAREMVLLPISGRARDRSSVYRLKTNATGVWELIDGERSVADIRDEIAERSDASPADVGLDVLAVLAELEDAGLVEKV